MVSTDDPILRSFLRKRILIDLTRAHAEQLDARDRLASLRDRFDISDPDLIYLDGNSLGRMPKSIRPLYAELLADWSERLIRIWGDKYIHIAQETGAQIAQLIGAQPNEVVIAESTSINLFKLAVAALRAQKGRFNILTDDMNFPSDLYILDGVCDLLGNQHRTAVVPSRDGIHGPADDLVAKIDGNTALVTLSHTVFKSAYTYDMGAISQAAHDAGALTIWDLSHSVGAVPVALNESNADMAIGCTYKYLNAGPGAPAFLYVRQDLQKKLRNFITGWMSQKNQFDFQLAYDPLPGIEQFLTGTPPVLSIAPIGAGVELLLEAGMENLRAKSVQQSEYLIDLWEKLLAPLGFALNSPRQSRYRGSHVSLGHKDGWRINQCMIHEMNIIPDFRAPDNIRLGIAPLYTTFVDIHTAVMRMKVIVEKKLYEKYPSDMSGVT